METNEAYLVSSWAALTQVAAAPDIFHVPTRECTGAVRHVRAGVNHLLASVKHSPIQSLWECKNNYDLLNFYITIKYVKSKKS
jgi:hypothetical protein